MTIPRLQATDDSDALATALEQQGCAIVEAAATADQLESTFEELGPYLEATATGEDDFSGEYTRRTGCLIERSTTVRDLIRWPLILDAVGKVLSKSASFQVHASQMIAIGPGETAQPVHRDQWAFNFFPFPKGWEVHCGALWAMTDFTEENGATRVVPGSHLFEDKRTIPVAETVPAEMSAGSVLVYTGSLYHGGGSNSSDATRYGLNLTYSASWLRQEENQYLSVPLEVARELPEDLQRLMGYARGGYALGYWGDLRDPMEVVRPEAARGGLGDLEAAGETYGVAGTPE